MKTCHGCGALSKYEPYGAGWFCFGLARFKCQSGKAIRIDPDNPPDCKHAKESKNELQRVSEK